LPAVLKVLLLKFNFIFLFGEYCYSSYSFILDGKRERAIVRIPRVDATFTGTGDLFAALFLAWSHLTKGDIQVSLDNTIATLQAVLKRTLTKAQSETSEISVV
jgi:pyridoxine kinase